MKRASIWIAAFVLVSGVALAGDYHSGSTLTCSQCHVMHAQTSHSYSGAGTATTYTPTHYLLKDEINNLCLSCHDDSFASDVLGLQNGGSVDLNRSGGALNRDGATVDKDALAGRGLINAKGGPVKLLGDGEAPKNLKVSLQAASASARQKIEAAGGSFEAVK